MDWAAVASGTARTLPDSQDDSPEAKELHCAIAMEKTLRDLLLQKLIDIPQQEVTVYPNKDLSVLGSQRLNAHQES